MKQEKMKIRILMKERQDNNQHLGSKQASSCMIHKDKNMMLLRISIWEMILKKMKLTGSVTRME